MFIKDILVNKKNLILLKVKENLFVSNKVREIELLANKGGSAEERRFLAKYLKFSEPNWSLFLKN